MFHGDFIQILWHFVFYLFDKPSFTGTNGLIQNSWLNSYEFILYFGSFYFNYFSSIHVRITMRR